MHSKSVNKGNETMNLKALRKAIDRLDDRIVRLLNRRASVAQQVGKWKHANANETYVPAREKKVLSNVRKANRGPLGHNALSAIYREIMSSSLALERPVRVAFLGPPSTFTHQAARARFGSSVSYLACETIGDIFEQVQKGRADYGVVPIENSTDGAVTHALDQFAGTPLKICAEIYLPISHYLMASVRNPRIRRILSKPEVFGQCRNWLHAEMPGVDLVPVSSTAKAAEIAAREKGAAAIASDLAAEMYHLNIVARDIQDMSGNMTRFLVIGRSYGKATGEDKSSLMFSVKHRAGSLYRALGSFRKYGINMTKIESRPSKLKAWEYFFFVDIEGHVDDPKVRKALRDLARHCMLLVVLGAYPRATELFVP
jgi:chorismate mutase/prephenate dehydratase